MLLPFVVEVVPERVRVICAYRKINLAKKNDAASPSGLKSFFEAVASAGEGFSRQNLENGC
jgi:hypothetical protein